MPSPSPARARKASGSTWIPAKRFAPLRTTCSSTILRAGLMSCIDPDTLAEMFASGSGARTRDSFERHVDGCAHCASSSRCTRARRTTRPTPGRLPRSHTPQPSRASARSSEGSADRRSARQPLHARSVVGEGGMGVVWAANDLVGQRRVAIKMLKTASPELARRSWREARAATFLAHPRSSRCSTCCRRRRPPRRRAAIVMPLLAGESLDRMLARADAFRHPRRSRSSCPSSPACTRRTSAASFIATFKPSNVFLAIDGDAPPVVLVLDFGLAKMLSDGTDDGADKLTRTGALLGTPHYMAPEQLFVIAASTRARTCGRSASSSTSASRADDPSRKILRTAREERDARRDHAHRGGGAGIDPRVAALATRMLAMERDARLASAKCTRRCVRSSVDDR